MVQGGLGLAFLPTEEFEHHRIDNIAEVKIIEPDVFGDHRGWFMETWSEPKYAQFGFKPVQDNESFPAQKGTLRGIHFQQSPMAQAKIVRVTRGAVMDVAMSISSACWELRELNPDLPRKALFRSGMNIGQDAMGTMANTLILAFAGSSLNTLLLFQIFDYPMIQIFNADSIAIEIIRGVAGTIGIILTVPLVALLSAEIMGPKKKA